nr:BTAD domain-containing putative transcriptional regulator [Glycomyces amatae]
MAVRTDAGEPVPVPERKVRALLARLLVDPGRPVGVERLIADVWGDRPPADPRAALQTKVSQLRRALAGIGVRVERLEDRYRLAVEAEQVDAGRFELLVERSAGAGAAERAALLEEALGLWRGPALAEYDALAAEAARLEERRLAALERLLDARLELGLHEAALGEAAALVERHPLRERLRSVHMRALYQAGRHSEALASFRDLRERLASELGLDPGLELRDLHRAMLGHDPALAAPTAPPRGNLPVPLTPLIGRDEHLSHLVSLLESSRLVTLTGPGGVGKTRLALGAAARFQGGAWLVELAGFEPGTDAPLLAAAVADAMGLNGAGPRAAQPAADPFALLRSALAGRRALLVVDNCEHLVAAAAELCAEVTAAAPEVRVLATSREALRVPGEQVLPVEPLDQGGAVRLFTARASAAQPGFAVTDENRAAVDAICERLDGLPLALELAATRVPALGVAALADQLADRLLSAETRGGPERQRTLRAVIDWSWRLLGPAERLVLGRLSVCAGGAALDTVQDLVAGELTEAAAVDALVQLVDRSLVHVAGDADRRFRLLDSVAAYCRERLREEGLHEEVAERHGRHFTALAEQSADRLRGPGQLAWMRRLEADSGNLHAALEAAARRGDADRALRIAVGLTWFWFLRSSLLEGGRALEAALAVEGPAAPGRAAAARFWRSCFAFMTASALGRGIADAPRHLADLADDRERAYAELFLAQTQIGVGSERELDALVRSSGAYFAEAGDPWGLAAVDGALAWTAIVRGDLDAARGLAARSRAAFAAAGDGWGELQALECLAVHAESTGDYELALRLNHEGLALAEGLGLRMEQSYRLSRLGRVRMLRGEFAASRRLHEEALAMAVEQSVRFCEMFAATGLMLLERRAGRLEEAERIAAEWLAWNAEPPALQDMAVMLLGERGFIAEMRGDGREALRLHEEALALLEGGEPGGGAVASVIDGVAGARALRGGPDGRSVAFVLEGLAGARSLLGEPERAAAALGEAAALRERAGAPLPDGERFDVDRIGRRVEGMIGADAFKAAYERGRAGAGPG